METHANALLCSVCKVAIPGDYLQRVGCSHVYCLSCGDSSLTQCLVHGCFSYNLPQFPSEVQQCKGLPQTDHAIGECAIHRTSTSMLNCNHCLKAVCSSCHTKEEQQCCSQTELMPLGDIAERRKNELLSAISQWDITKQRRLKTIEEIEPMISQLSLKFEEIDRSIDQEYEKKLQELSRWRDVLRSDADEHFKETQEWLEKARGEIEACMSASDSHVNYCQYLLHKGHAIDIAKQQPYLQKALKSNKPDAGGINPPSLIHYPMETNPNLSIHSNPLGHLSLMKYITFNSLHTLSDCRYLPDREKIVVSGSRNTIDSFPFGSHMTDIGLKQDVSSGMCFNKDRTRLYCTSGWKTEVSIIDITKTVPEHIQTFSVEDAEFLRGVTRWKEDTIMIADPHKNRITVHKADGERTATVIKDNTQGKPLFDFIRYASWTGGSRFFATDRKTVMCIEAKEDANVYEKVWSVKLDNPWIVTNSGHEVYVTRYNSSKVTVLSQEGEVIGEIEAPGERAIRVQRCRDGGAEFYLISYSSACTNDI